jgi:hypothetical protein
MRSSPLEEMMFPVERKCPTFFPMPPEEMPEYLSKSLLQKVVS